MNSQKRVLLSIDHKEADRVPLDLGGGRSCKFTKQFYLKLIEFLGLGHLADSIQINNEIIQTVFAHEEVLNQLCCDVIEPVWQMGDVTETQESRWEDEDNYYLINDWGTTYRMPKSLELYYSAIDYPLKNSKNEETDSQYQWPIPKKVSKDSIQQAKSYREKGYAVAVTKTYGDGFLQTAPEIFGYDIWLMMLVGEKKRVHSFLEKQLEKKKNFWDNILENTDGLIDIVSESDDLGTQNGPFISLDMFREMILPYYKKLFEYIKSKTSAKLFMHSCGDIFQYIPDLIDAGVDIINPVQITAKDMEPAKLKTEFGKDITFWGGGVDTQYTLPQGSKQQIQDMVKKNIEVLGKDGGYIFSTIHNVQADVPVENFITMLETFNRYAKY